jgi:CBS-domain-containing membrane protein
MPIIAYRNVLQGLTVQEAMRRQVISLPRDATLEQAVRFCIKYKVNALLIIGEQQEGLGVVSKTDLMGAYYAGLPISTPCTPRRRAPGIYSWPSWRSPVRGMKSCPAWQVRESVLTP